jgi:hypothetical protein
MGVISGRTAELALTSLGVAWRLAAPRRNGLALPQDWRVAFAELAAIAHSPTGSSERTDSPPVTPSATPLELISTDQAAARLKCRGGLCRSGVRPARCRPGRSAASGWSSGRRQASGTGNRGAAVSGDRAADQCQDRRTRREDSRRGAVVRDGASADLCGEISGGCRGGHPGSAGADSGWAGPEPRYGCSAGRSCDRQPGHRRCSEA